MNVESAFLSGPNLKIAAQHLQDLFGGIQMTWFEVMGRLLPVWMLFSDRRGALLSAIEIDAVAEMQGFTRALVAASLAEEIEIVPRPGDVSAPRTCGLPVLPVSKFKILLDIEWLHQLDVNSAKGVAARKAKKASAVVDHHDQPVNRAVDPPVYPPTPTPTPTPTLSRRSRADPGVVFAPLRSGVHAGGDHVPPSRTEATREPPGSPEGEPKASKGSDSLSETRVLDQQGRVLVQQAVPNEGQAEAEAGPSGPIAIVMSGQTPDMSGHVTDTSRLVTDIVTRAASAARPMRAPDPDEIYANDPEKLAELTQLRANQADAAARARLKELYAEAKAAFAGP